MWTWVRDRKPTTRKQAGELADEYLQSRLMCSSTAIYVHSKPFVSQKRCFLCNQVRHFVKDCPVAHSVEKSKQEAKKDAASSPEGVTKVQSNPTVMSSKSK